MPSIPEHGFEVIDDATAAAHAATGNDDGWACSLSKVVDDALVVAVAVDGDQLFEGQRAAPGLDAFAGLLVPIRLEVSIGLGEAARERRIEDDRELGPVGFRVRLGLSAGLCSPHPSPLP